MNKKRPSLLALAMLSLSLLTGAVPRAAMARQADGVALGALTEGKSVNGFRAEALYLNDSDQPFGARLRHERTGFTLDYMEMQSVPQAFMWVNSFPTADHGEPHTQEHLLLGKGNVGRAHAGLESMSLAGSSAFTMQWRTAYHLHTAAGAEIYYKLFESQVDALLHPDYTDEEIRREVSHWGVSENPADKKLKLEEKGTVYQEMASTYERPVSLLFREVNQMLYGDAHPLALSAGGWPSSIREMKPEHIRKFHADNYRLGNMGMVASFPKEMPLASVLTRLDQILEPAGAEAGEARLPFRVRPARAEAGSRGDGRAGRVPAQERAAAGLGDVRVARAAQARHAREDAAQPLPLERGERPDDQSLQALRRYEDARHGHGREGRLRLPRRRDGRRATPSTSA